MLAQVVSQGVARMQDAVGQHQAPPPVLTQPLTPGGPPPEEHW